MGIVHARDFVDDGEAEPATAAGRSGHAIETLKDMRTVGLGNTRAVILNLQESATFATPATHGDATAHRRVVQGIVDQVGEQLAQQPGAAVNAYRLGFRAEIDMREQGTIEMARDGFRDE